MGTTNTVSVTTVYENYQCSFSSCSVWELPIVSVTIVYENYRYNFSNHNVPEVVSSKRFVGNHRDGYYIQHKYLYSSKLPISSYFHKARPHFSKHIDICTFLCFLMQFISATVSIPVAVQLWRYIQITNHGTCQFMTFQVTVNTKNSMHPRGKVHHTLCQVFPDAPHAHITLRSPLFLLIWP